MICNNCGKEIEQNAMFCSFCGVKLSDGLTNTEGSAESDISKEEAIERGIKAIDKLIDDNILKGGPVVDESVPAPTHVPAPAPVSTAAPASEPASAPAPKPVQANGYNGFSQPVPPPPPMPCIDNRKPVMPPKAEKPKTFFGKGALALCLIIIGILSCSTTVFATLFFTLLGKM